MADHRYLHLLVFFFSPEIGCNVVTVTILLGGGKEVRRALIGIGSLFGLFGVGVRRLLA